MLLYLPARRHFSSYHFNFLISLLSLQVADCCLHIATHVLEIAVYRPKSDFTFKPLPKVTSEFTYVPETRLISEVDDPRNGLVNCTVTQPIVRPICHPNGWCMFFNLTGASTAPYCQCAPKWMGPECLTSSYVFDPDMSTLNTDVSNLTDKIKLSSVTTGVVILILATAFVIVVLCYSVRKVRADGTYTPVSASRAVSHESSRPSEGDDRPKLRFKDLPHRYRAAPAGSLTQNRLTEAEQRREARDSTNIDSQLRARWRLSKLAFIDTTEEDLTIFAEAEPFLGNGRHSPVTARKSEEHRISLRSQTLDNTVESETAV